MKKIRQHGRQLFAGMSALAMLLSLIVCRPETNREDKEHTADELARAAVAASGRDPDSLERLGDVLDDAGIMERANDIKYSSTGFVNEVCKTNREEYINSNGGVPFISSEYRLIEGKYAAFLLSDLDFGAYAFAVLEAFYRIQGLEPTKPFETFLFNPPALDGGQPPETPPASVPPTDPITGRLPFVDPEKEDMTVYDTSAILAAWKKRDPSGLSDYDRAIYNAAVRVLEETVRDNMTGYEKEYALYMWTITHVEYDRDLQDTLAAVSRDSYTPYGGLVNHKGICLGFASAFQLLMDMAGVECITVVGAAENSTEDHAWNQVRLDGEWYCVDATWDYGYYPTLGNLYWFNRTSDFFAETSPGHQWDYGSVPEAEGTQYAVS